ncbi:MAG TPA: hypothetical protein PKW57_07470, partial [Anaerolineaceae bacterium]|nr:hypothetical protein [Anaerolineaceae bacterium]
TVHEAFHIASTGRPGPVLIDITKDVLQGQAHYAPVGEIHLPGYKVVTDGHAGQIRRAAQMMWEAKRPLVYGGGVSLAPNEQGTPQPGISGSTGDLTNFAPVGSSNVVLLGELPVGASVETEQQFVVNVSTVPGAYPLKVSLVYTAPGGTRAVDDQLITLLVYALPQLEVSFYRDPGMFYNGMMTALPIQITNLSRKTTVLGNMTVSSENADLQNNTSLVGTLDPGGYFTWDVMYTPFGEGPTKIHVSINYTDDFNQLRVYETALEIEVQPPMEIPQEPLPGEGEMPVEPEQPVGFWAKIWNVIKGFLGIGTGSSTEQPVEVPMEEGSKNVP